MYREITYTEVLAKILGVMDASAVAMCRDNRLPIVGFQSERPRQYNANGDGRTSRHADSSNWRRYETRTIHATPASSTFQTVKEIEANAKTRMEKALADLQHDMASDPHRPRLREPA